jgi:hypothetical protein
MICRRTREISRHKGEEIPACNCDEGLGPVYPDHNVVEVSYPLLMPIPHILAVTDIRSLVKLLESHRIGIRVTVKALG